jgi:ubiquinone biosynthesis protein COQ9
MSKELIKNFALGALAGIVLAGSVMGMIAFLRIERDEYRIKRAEQIAVDAKASVDDMRDKLLLPRIATPEEINDQIKAK